MAENMARKPEHLAGIKPLIHGETIAMEGINYTINAPDTDPSDIFFVQVNKDDCQACGECESYCPTGAIQEMHEDGEHGIVAPAACVNCGQCLANCPFGAIQEQVSFVGEVLEKLKDPNVTVVSMPAPAVRYALGECFGGETGTYSGGKMHAALRRLGFDRIWDTEFAADVTVMEEGTELIERVMHGNKPLPQFTSCCPGWIKFAETFFPDLNEHLSTCRSPIGMLGSLAKTYGAQESGVKAKDIYTVSIMPCIAKKFEGMRPELNASGGKDIDATINTRELAWLIKKAGIDFNALPEEEADPALGMSTGAATLFCTSGGVMEAALRLAYEKLSGEKLADPEIKMVRTSEGLKTADINIPTFGVVKVAIVSGLEAAKEVCQQVRDGKSPYHFIEVMTCAGGCVNGGGQPLEPGILEASLFKSTVAKINHRFTKRTIKA
ncbi:MAG: [FeFe] hydrogenase, group A [Desulfovibrionales bacterium]|nr:[FeFe] hydrogenase, group A [Desulfovibrionales bacterium]